MAMPPQRDQQPSPEPSAAQDVVEIRTTFATRAAAEDCAARLVADRVAACVQIDGPLQSTYRWEAAVQTATEYRCTCKTTRERMQDCSAAITRLHDYQTPEILVAVVSASPVYAAWVRSNVAQP
jgi:periplasmic divalent cation tolerance protein